MAETTGSVLIVDDDSHLAAAYARALVAAGLTVDKATNGRLAIARIAETRFDAVVSDISMPELDGIELLRAIREGDLDVPVVLMTASASLETAMQAVQFGALRYLQKPVDLTELVSVVENAVRLGRLARLKREAFSVLGSSSKEPGDRASLEIAFKRALDGLWMAYQPIVHYGQRRNIAYEALLRSSDATLSNPGMIIGAAERLGALPTLGRAMRKHIADTLAKTPIPQVFVNLHPSDLSDDDLYSADSPLTRIASRVVLEITERASLDDVSEIQAKIARLRRLGFRIAVDDLGAGYAGLNSIANLEPEVMKIDMTLIRDVDVTSSKQKVIGAMVSLCAEMNVMVVAEGVETKMEREALRRQGCEVMQGYLFAKPAKPFPEAVF